MYGQVLKRNGREMLSLQAGEEARGHNPFLILGDWVWDDGFELGRHLFVRD